MRIEEMPGWKGDIDRIEAEKTLETQQLGTYVLHRGRVWTRVFSTNGAVEVFLVTIKEKDKKISEQMILHTDRGWTVYRDNPDVNDTEYYEYFASLPEALKKLVPTAKTPLN